MQMPHSNGWSWRTVKGDLNLWKLIPIRHNLRRALPGKRSRLLFFKGHFPDNQVLNYERERGSQREGKKTVER
jgi:hypothetical protein